MHFLKLSFLLKTNNNFPMLICVLFLKSGSDEGSSYLNSSSKSNVINRVTQEQSKWKRQVQEQRRTVYDRHVILN